MVTFEAVGEGVQVGQVVGAESYILMDVLHDWADEQCVAILSAISVVATFFTPETRGRDLDDLRDAGQEVGI